jgi:hypothetical protein
VVKEEAPKEDTTKGRQNLSKSNSEPDSKERGKDPKDQR